MKIFGTIIKRFLASFGLEIYKIGDTRNKWENMPDDFALTINSPLAINEWYSKDKHVNDYLSNDRIIFYNELISLTVKQGIVFKNKAILDVGCGSGALLNEINKKYHDCDLTGIDLSRTAIEYARKKMPGILFEVKDIFQSSTEKKYDIIFCTEVLEHLLNPALSSKKLLNLMPDDGILILTVPNGRKDNFIGHINFWSPESWPLFLNDQLPSCEIKTLTMENNNTNLAFIAKKRA